MTTSTLRVLIIIAAVVLGVVVLRGAFPANTSQGITGAAVRTTVRTTSPRATPSPARTTARPSPSPSPSPKPKVKGVVVQVLNGTITAGLAAAVSERLSDAGYTVKTPGNVAAASKTTIYYQGDHKVDADFMKKKYFPKGVVAPAPAQFPTSVDLTVVLGSDFSLSSLSPSP